MVFDLESRVVDRKTLKTYTVESKLYALTAVNLGIKTNILFLFFIKYNIIG
jgi:hypothetical protein